MNKSEQINELAKAMVKVQAVLEGAVKDTQNPFFKAKYANLEACWDAIKEPLTKNGLCVIQTMGHLSEGGPSIITTLIHESGQWISGEQPLCAKALSPQDMGSAITYGRRYGLAAIIGLVQVDDDGEGAAKRPTWESNSTTVAPPSGDPGEYRITFGKFNGKSLKEVTEKDIRSYIEYLEKKAAADGKPAGKNVLELKSVCDAFYSKDEEIPF
jgi:hypothetical protein